jgi:predicted aconitase with swiveling domain
MKMKNKHQQSMIIKTCRKIVGGKGEGNALLSSKPINFLSMLDRKTGKVVDPKHPLFGKSIKGSVLVFPYAIGSSVGAYAIYSLAKNNVAPSAIVCFKTDITTASGCAIANIPTVDIDEQELVSDIGPGTRLVVEADKARIIVLASKPRRDQQQT